MNFKVLSISAALAVTATFAHGQSDVRQPISSGVVKVKSSQSYKPTGVGDSCPDIEFKEVINYKNKSVKISDFRGRWLILDFYFVNCAPCITMLPKCAGFEKQFDGKVQFLPITYNNAKEVEKLFKRLNGGAGLRSTSVINEPSGTAIYKLFPHITDPHYVWIDPNGIVRAITGFEEITESNIRKMLSMPTTSLPLKDDFAATRVPKGRYNELLPLFIGNNGMIDSSDVRKVRYHSVITNFIKVSFLADTYSNIIDPTNIRIINYPVADLFRFAFARYPGEDMYPISRTILEIGDTVVNLAKDSIITKYSFPMMGWVARRAEWIKENGYSYNLKLDSSYRPFSLSTSFAEIRRSVKAPTYRKIWQKSMTYMRQDLTRQFPIDARLETRVMDCFVLTVSDTSKLHSAVGTITQIDRDKFTHATMKHVSMSQFVDEMQYYVLRTPLIDGTNFKGNFDIDIQAEMLSFNSLNTALEKYGLKMVPAKRPIEVLVLTTIKDDL